MDLPEVFQKLAIALGLGLLVGMQRERVQAQLAGIRTFALITVFGGVCGLLAKEFDGWIIAAGGVALAALMAVSNVAFAKAKDADPGLTTEIAALLMFGIGAYVAVSEHTAVGVALGGVVALLLHFKEPMHQFVAKIGETDIKAIMQFVLITLVILPVLPNERYGPYGAFNPYTIWFMVVLIVAINLAGYVASKFFGEDLGAVLAGILGGLVSSTATTASYARRTSSSPDLANVAALVIMIATTIATVRVLTEIAIVAPTYFWQLAPPLLALLVWMVLIAAALAFLGKRGKAQLTSHSNPAELKAAIFFGVLYAVVVFAVAAAKDYFPQSGLYVVAVLSGLHDLDAITLSTSNYVNQLELETTVAWRVILIAAMANLVMKGVIAATLGHRLLTVRVAAAFGAAFLGGAAVLMFWPDIPVSPPAPE